MEQGYKERFVTYEYEVADHQSTSSAVTTSCESREEPADTTWTNCLRIRANEEGVPWRPDKLASFRLFWNLTSMLLTSVICVGTKISPKKKNVIFFRSCRKLTPRGLFWFFRRKLDHLSSIVLHWFHTKLFKTQKQTLSLLACES